MKFIGVQILDDLLNAKKQTYLEADQKKLTQLYYKHESANELITSIQNAYSNVNVFFREAIKNKMGERLFNGNFFDSQAKEFIKQWKIMSASMLKVNRSISLNNFSNNIDLWINPEYGIKRYRTLCSFSPFSSWKILGKNKCCIWNNEKLIINNIDVYDFSVLYSISQLDNKRIKLLINMTKEIVNYINSLNKFHNKNINNNDIFSLIENIERYVYYGNNELKKYIENLDKMIKFKKNFIFKRDNELKKWNKIIDKWKDCNKNFLVLHKLKRSKLKINAY